MLVSLPKASQFPISSFSKERSGEKTGDKTKPRQPTMHPQFRNASPRRALASFALAILSVTTVNAACETECAPISQGLEACSLPLLTSLDWKTLKDKGTTDRKFTDPPPDDVDRWLGGPFTHVLETAAQANCFCIEARANFDACDRCLLAAPLTGESTENESGSLEIYMDDCVNMGYYANQTLAYPSTTRSSAPSATVPVRGVAFAGDSDDEGGADDNCENLCGIANGQIVECGLAPLDVPEDDRPRPQTVTSPDRAYLGWVLLNRTAAECVCTTPFLRRILGCELCLVEKERRDLALVGHHHRFDCHQLGYYSDAQYLLPGPEDVGGGGGGSGAGSGGSSTGDDESGARLCFVPGTALALGMLGLGMLLRAV